MTMNDRGGRARWMRTGGAAAILLGALGALGAGGQAWATDGYFSSGYGTQSKGLAGAGLAYPKDSLAIATNPAAGVALGDRVDVDVDYFQSGREAEIVGAGPDQSFGGNGGGPQPIPEFGLVRKVGANLALGLAVYGNGGMATDYKSNPFTRFGATGAAGVSLEQIFVSPTASFQFAPGQSLGVGINVAGQLFKAEGVGPFSGSSVNPANFTNRGSTSSVGYGGKIGYLGQLTPKLSVGAFWQSRTYSGKFGPYSGLFAGGGGFDIPSAYGAGVAYKATDRLDLVADIKRIDYSEVPAVGDPLNLLFAGKLFGSPGGPGFGWKDVTAYKLGANYRINPAWQVRAGWGYATSPVPSSQTLLNILAPGVVSNQLTVGATWTRSSGLEVSGYVLDAPKNTIHGSGSIPAGFGGGEANISLSELVVGVGFGWKH